MANAESNDSDMPAENKEVVIVLVGKSGAGKTTLFNNLLGIDEHPPLTPGPDTITTTTRKLMEKEGLKVYVTDSPGGLDLKKETTGTIDILIYCLAVGPGSDFDVCQNPKIIERLQYEYTEKIWNHCIIVCTFSDLLKKRENDDQKYKDNFKEIATKFTNELEKYGKKVTIKTVFDLAPDKNTNDQCNILVIPAALELNEKLLPGAESRDNCNGWRDILFNEMVKASKDSYKMAMNPVISSSTPPSVKPALTKMAAIIGVHSAGGATILGGIAWSAGFKGGAIGAKIGAKIGLSGGVVGASMGAAAGCLAGVVLGLSGTGCYYLYREYMIKKQQ